MRTDRPTHATTIVQWAIVVAVGVGLIFAIRAVRISAPVTDQDFTVPQAVTDEALITTAEKCERTLAEAPVLPDTDGVRTFGRISSAAVVECPDLFDRHFVTYVGEVVGDILRRDGGAWVLVNDDAYAVEVGPAASSGQLRGGNSGLAVWLPDPLPERLTRAGGHGLRGDVVLVSGHIWRVDPQDGGGLTLRADDLEVLAESTAAETPFNTGQAVLAGGLVAIVIGLAIVERRAAARR